MIWLYNAKRPPAGARGNAEGEEQELKDAEERRKDPPPLGEPDVATKPPNIVRYSFAFVCPDLHIGTSFEEASVDRLISRVPCQVCGQVARPAVVKKTWEAQWVQGWFGWPGDWVSYWLQPYHFQSAVDPQGRSESDWTKLEVIRFLSEDPRTAAEKKEEPWGLSQNLTVLPHRNGYGRPTGTDL